jgi:hypothetical protein
MHLGKELLRTCLAGLAVHLVVVAACSAGDGADGSPEFRLTRGSDAGRAPGPAGTPQESSQTGIPDAGHAPPSLLVPVAEAKANESGARIKARWYLGEDGSREFLGWFDAELGTDCRFDRARDGVLRCLPSAGATPMYSNADCTSDILFSVALDACENQPPTVGIVVGSIVANGCAVNQYRYFTLGNEVVPGALFFLSGSLCKPAAVDSSHTYWSPGAELTPSRFSPAQVVTE